MKSLEPISVLTFWDEMIGSYQKIALPWHLGRIHIGPQWYRFMVHLIRLSPGACHQSSPEPTTQIKKSRETRVMGLEHLSQQMFQIPRNIANSSAECNMIY